MKERILVVEDEVDIASPIKYALEKDGYDVSLAASGEDGLEKLRRLNHNLIVLDLMLPGISGEEVCRRIRKDGRKDGMPINIPIIMLTAKDTDVDKIIGRVIGADCYITKPFNMEDLLSKIRLLLGSSSV